MNCFTLSEIFFAAYACSIWKIAIADKEINKIDMGTIDRLEELISISSKAGNDQKDIENLAKKVGEFKREIIDMHVNACLNVPWMIVYYLFPYLGVASFVIGLVRLVV